MIGIQTLKTVYTIVLSYYHLKWLKTSASHDSEDVYNKGPEYVQVINPCLILNITIGCSQ